MLRRFLLRVPLRELVDPMDLPAPIALPRAVRPPRGAVPRTSPRPERRTAVERVPTTNVPQAVHRTGSSWHLPPDLPLEHERCERPIDEKATVPQSRRSSHHQCASTFGSHMNMHEVN